MFPMTLEGEITMRHLILTYIKHQLHRVRRRHILCAILLASLYFIICNFIHHFDQPDHSELNSLIEDLLKTNVLLEKGAGCLLPELDIFSQEVVDNIDLKYRPKIVCRDTDIDWVTCNKSECYVTLKELKDDVECTYTDIIYVNDNSYYLDDPITVVGYDKYLLNRSDHVKISCTATTWNIFGIPILSHWSGFKSGFRPVPIKPTLLERKDAYNVVILLFDSTSLNSFIRFMPKSYKLLSEEMGAVILNSYSAIADDTATNLFAIFTGKRPTEVFETRQSMSKEHFLDNKNIVFHRVKQVGYRTSYFEGLHGSFLHNNALKQQSVDHYLRAFMLEVEKNKQKMWFNDNNERCVGATPLYQLMLNLTKDFLDLDGKKFSYTQLYETAHDKYTTIFNVEDALIEFLNTLRARRVLEDTMVIVMGDRGQRFGNFHNTFQGKLEEYLPLMAIMLPERLKRLSPSAFKALKRNKDVLTTHFDLYATIMDVLDLPNTDSYAVPGSDLPRSMSLLRKIPDSRTCSEAGILPYCCVCFNWYDVPRTDPKFDQVINIFVVYINGIIEEKRDKCHDRDVIFVEWVRRRGARNYVQMDKKLDRYLSYPTVMQPSTEYYQTKVVMSPDKAVFEATMVYNIKLDYFDVLNDNIFRIDKYGDE